MYKFHSIVQDLKNQITSNPKVVYTKTKMSHRHKFFGALGEDMLGANIVLMGSVGAGKSTTVKYFLDLCDRTNILDRDYTVGWCQPYAMLICSEPFDANAAYMCRNMYATWCKDRGDPVDCSHKDCSNYQPYQWEMYCAYNYARRQQVALSFAAACLEIGVRPLVVYDRFLPDVAYWIDLIPPPKKKGEDMTLKVNSIQTVQIPDFSPGSMLNIAYHCLVDSKSKLISDWETYELLFRQLFVQTDRVKVLTLGLYHEAPGPVLQDRIVRRAGLMPMSTPEEVAWRQMRMWESQWFKGFSHPEWLCMLYNLKQSQYSVWINKIWYDVDTTVDGALDLLWGRIGQEFSCDIALGSIPGYTPLNKHIKFDSDSD